jgi:hypothetical protein
LHHPWKHDNVFMTNLRGSHCCVFNYKIMCHVPLFADWPLYLRGLSILHALE